MEPQTAVLEPVKPAAAKNPQRVLVIRSAARVFSQTLDSLRAEFPGIKITVLAPQSLKDALEQDERISQLIPLPDSRMTVFSCGSDLIHRLRGQKFDLAVSLYNVEQGLGYSNIDLIAWAAKPRRVRGYNSKGKWIELDGRAIFRKMVREKSSGAMMLLNAVATVILLGAITLGVGAEWIFRKLFQGGANGAPPASR